MLHVKGCPKGLEGKEVPQKGSSPYSVFPTQGQSLFPKFTAPSLYNLKEPGRQKGNQILLEIRRYQEKTVEGESRLQNR